MDTERQIKPYSLEKIATGFGDRSVREIARQVVELNVNARQRLEKSAIDAAGATLSALTLFAIGNSFHDIQNTGMSIFYASLGVAAGLVTTYSAHSMVRDFGQFQAHRNRSVMMEQEVVRHYLDGNY